ncbi:MAG: hypothetical protein ACREND_16545 [Gemmatimonadaceae bacterium]
MRTAAVARVLTALVLAACSGDRLTNVARTPSPPERETLQRDILLNNSGSPAEELTVAAINDSNVVTGSLTDGSPQVATIWTPPNYNPTALPLPGDTGTSLGTRIANDGTVLGKICDSAAQHCKWVTWKNGTITPVTPQGDARDICPCDGPVIVGGLMVGGVQHAVIWTHGKLLDVGMPPGSTGAEFVAVDEGFMAGNATGPGGGTFRWSPQFGFQMLPGADTALDVNSSGTVLVSNDRVYPLGGPPIAFPTDFETGNFSMGTALNDSGWVAGVWTLRAVEQLPPPTAGAWKIGTDNVVQVNAGEGSQGLDINNSDVEIGQGFVGPGVFVNEGWVLAFLH